MKQLTSVFRLCLGSSKCRRKCLSKSETSPTALRCPLTVRHDSSQAHFPLLATQAVHGMASSNCWMCLVLAVLPVAFAQASNQSISVNGTGGFSLSDVLLCSVEPTLETFQSITQPEIWYIVATNFYGNNEYDVFALNVSDCDVVVLPVADFFNEVGLAGNCKGSQSTSVSNTQAAGRRLLQQASLRTLAVANLEGEQAHRCLHEAHC